MNTFFKNKLFTPFMALLLMLACLAGGSGVTYYAFEKENFVPRTPEEMYAAAVRDAVFADEDEILPLVNLDHNSDMVTWNDAGDKVLLLSWHKYPDSYPTGADVALTWGEVWTFTDREIVNAYQKEKGDVTDWTLRLKQLIGLPPDSANTYFTAFWVSPDDVIRPAYVTDTTKQMQNHFSETTDDSDPFYQWYRNWFNGNIIHSYFDSAYPWTRLGYTYDWDDNGKKYGLSEFLVRKDAAVNVEFTLSTEDFIAWLDQQNA